MHAFWNSPSLRVAISCPACARSPSKSSAPCSRRSLSSDSRPAQSLSRKHPVRTNSSTVNPFILGIPVGIRIHLAGEGVCAGTCGRPWPHEWEGPTAAPAGALRTGRDVAKRRVSAYIPSQANVLSKVLFPQPLAPARRTHSPPSRWKVTSGARTCAP